MEKNITEMEEIAFVARELKLLDRDLAKTGGHISNIGEINPGYELLPIDIHVIFNRKIIREHIRDYQ